MPDSDAWQVTASLPYSQSETVCSPRIDPPPFAAGRALVTTTGATEYVQHHLRHFATPKGAIDYVAQMDTFLDECSTYRDIGITVTASAHDGPVYGDETSAIRLVLDYGTHQAVIIHITVRVGNVVSIVQHLGVAPDEDVTELLAQGLAERLESAGF